MENPDVAPSPRSARRTPPAPKRRILLLAGPSGSGKGRLGKLSGLPVVNLDDFYRDHTDRGLPEAWGIVDWDHPDSWHKDQALDALESLCHSDSALLPTYSISTSQRTGSRVVDVTGAPLIIAEGIFAAELVGPLQERGLLAEAMVLDRSASLVFLLRFVRDVRQSRKSLPTLVRRGWGLARSQSADVAKWRSAGMQPYALRPASRRVRELSLVAQADQHTTVAEHAHGHRVIHVSAVCFVTRQATLQKVVRSSPNTAAGAPPRAPGPQWCVLAVRKRRTRAFMQPGGKPEVGENPVQCATREIAEELGVTLDPDALESLGHASTAAANEPGTRLEADLFLAPEVTDPCAFTAQAEIEEARWIPLEDAERGEAPDGTVIAPLFRDIVAPLLRERLGSMLTGPGPSRL